MALIYLTDIKWFANDDPNKGFKLEFYSDPNPHFKNSYLDKSPFFKKLQGRRLNGFQENARHISS